MTHSNKYNGTGVRIDEETGCPELHIRGEYIASWSEGLKIDAILTGVILAAYEEGKRQRSLEIRKLIG